MRSALAVVIAVALPAQAGIGSALAKLSKAGRVGSTAVKVSRTAKLARLAGGVSTVVVAERAAASLGGVAVESAGYLARSSSGELVMLAKGSAAPMAVDDVAQAARRLGTNATVVLDPTVAASPEALRALPADVELLVADGPRRLPVRRVDQDGVVNFVVEHGDTAMDLADFAAGLVPDDAADDEDVSPVTAVVLGAMTLGAWLVWKRHRAAS
ncbi:MAG: hypothetical protein JNJ54_28865 [Myxococcaceae bacterium]|nr:hypothetical protein [Myxococcaceae bacterium]